MSPEERQAIRERANKATRGPWQNVRAAYEDCLVCDVDGVGYCINRDADFIAHAREDVPKLLDEVERLENENTYHSLQLDRAREEVFQLREELQSTKRTLNNYVHEYNIC